MSAHLLEQLVGSARNDPCHAPNFQQWYGRRIPVCELVMLGKTNWGNIKNYPALASLGCSAMQRSDPPSSQLTPPTAIHSFRFHPCMLTVMVLGDAHIVHKVLKNTGHWKSSQTA